MSAEGNFREGRFREGSFREGSFWEGSLREGSFREGRCPQRPYYDTSIGIVYPTYIADLLQGAALVAVRNLYM